MIKPVKPVTFLVLALIAATVFFPAAVFAQAAAAPASASPLTTLLHYLVTPAAIGYAVTIAAALVPKSSGPGLWSFVRGLIDLIGANWGNAKNAP